MEEHERILEILADFPCERTWLLPALWEIVDAVGWLNPDRIEWVSEHLRIPYAEVYGVASFYSLFSWEAVAPQTVHVCTDIMCALKSSPQMLDDLERVAQNGKFSVYGVSCLGRCDAAPACLINNEPYGFTSTAAVIEKIQAFAEGASEVGETV